MRVAVIHNFHHRAEPSGEDVMVTAEVAALRRAGVEVVLAQADNDAESVRLLPRLRGAVTTASGMGPRPLRSSADLLHVHNVFPYLPTRWLASAGVPIVATMHSYRPLCATGYLFRDGHICTECPDGSRWAGVRHGCYRSRLATVPLAMAGRSGPSKDRVLRASDRIIVLSERSRSLFSAAGVDPARLVLDRHFLPDDGVPSHLSDGAGPWLVVGRLSEEKGVGPLVEAWPGDRDLRVIGDGPEAGRIRAAAQGKSVELVGTLSRQEVLAEIRRSRGVVVPSRWYETFGLVYMEALAAGVPTLAFDPNVVADRVRLDGTGLVASFATLEQDLAEADRLFPALRSRCRAVFERDHTEASFVQRRTDLYRALVARQPAGS